MSHAQVGTTFEEVIVPHLDAAYRLARWLLRHEEDAEDAVQEACMKAVRHFQTFAGINGRAWFLRIVRNVCFTRRPSRSQLPDLFDEERHSTEQPGLDPETLLIYTTNSALVERALNSMPDHFRAVLVLRELEGLSYRELSDVLEVPLGTVMSRLSRARRALLGALQKELPHCSAATSCP